MTYSGRGGPNVSEFIANLNAIPPTQDVSNPENFSLDDDLAMFTNTQFFDFDGGQDVNIRSQSFDFGAQGNAAEAVAPVLDEKNLDFLQEDFQFPDFSSFPPQPAFGPDGLPMVHPIHAGQPLYSATSSTASPQNGAVSPHTGDKRKVELFNYGLEDDSRGAAEEDKRRRNTAASARFRVKKKQREQALEKSAKEMSDKMAALDARINQLETENKWLKNLVMEKNGNKDDITQLWKKFREESIERKGSECKDGVGTEKEKEEEEEKEKKQEHA